MKSFSFSSRRRRTWKIKRGSQWDSSVIVTLPKTRFRPIYTLFSSHEIRLEVGMKTSDFIAHLLSSPKVKFVLLCTSYTRCSLSGRRQERYFLKRVEPSPLSPSSTSLSREGTGFDRQPINQIKKPIRKS